VPQPEAITSAAQLTSMRLSSLAASHPLLTLIDPKASLCKDGRCKVADGTSVYYADNQHLSLFGSRLVLSQLDWAALKAP
jgi:hypothetical protein